MVAHFFTNNGKGIASIFCGDAARRMLLTMAKFCAGDVRKKVESGYIEVKVFIIKEEADEMYLT